MLNQETLLMSWRRSAIKVVNDSAPVVKSILPTIKYAFLNGLKIDSTWFEVSCNFNHDFKYIKVPES